MSVDCSICLSKVKEPVSIPCGHIYCTRCLADHVNAPNDEDVSKSSCPTCRTPFNTVTPDLTYLPKKYHQYVIPSVRRVYFDTTRQDDLQEKLAAAEAKIKKLERDQETLLRQCERHMAAASAHKAGERVALREADLLRAALNTRERDYAIAKEAADQVYVQVENERDELSRKYQDLKRRHSDLKQKVNEADASKASLSASQRSGRDSSLHSRDASRRPPASLTDDPSDFNFDSDPSSSAAWPAPDVLPCRRRAPVSVSLDPSMSANVSGNTSRANGARVIRPMPVRARMKGRPRPASPPPMFGCFSKRQRLSTE
ncbi:putative RING-type zinc-finger [Lyophyllum shimeji]|uniref:RING-type zinc-finger n=1 Tax=Lyophyllum shimeji TaxID=47721 RepID=A0A9P3PUS9_LYOSH|nr:putative RING-type zinc-finger [Lyophyllum shimeji]